jgi:hypothetical protein
MAVEHMVWIRFHNAVDESRKQHHLAELAALQSRVPGVVDLKLGANFTDRAGGYTHGLIVTFADRDALENYMIHPEHVAVAQPLKEDADLLAMDIEV